MSRSCAQTMTDINLNDLKSLLHDNLYKEALELVEKVENEAWFGNSSWDIIPLVCSHITENNVKVKPELVNCCQQILNKISNFCAPEETLFELLDKLECKNNDVLLLSLLDPVDIILNRLPGRKVQSLEWCLLALKASLAAIDFENLNRVQLVFSKVEQFYVRYCKKYANRNKPSEEFLAEPKQREDWDGARTSLSSFVLHCLAMLSTSEHQMFSKTLVHCLADVLPSLDVPLLFYVQQYTQRKCDSHCWADVPKSAFQVLYYEVLYHQICIAQFPCVYSHQYLVNNVTLLASELLQSKIEMKQIQGLNLLETIVNQASPECVHYRSLALNRHRRTFKCLSKIMVFNEKKEIREQTTKLLQKYILTLDPKGRYLYIHHASFNTDHEGLKGYLITQIKEITLEYWGRDNYFIDNVARLVCSVCKLDKGAETLLFETPDSVISSLNLIRFLMLKDPKNQSLEMCPKSVKTTPNDPGTLKDPVLEKMSSKNSKLEKSVPEIPLNPSEMHLKDPKKEGRNVTGIWDIEDYLKTNYIAQVTEALGKSKEYLKEQMNDAKSLELRDKKSQEKVANLSVTIGSQTIPFPKYDEEVRGIKAKLNTVDFIEFTLDAVKQLL